MKRIVSLFCAAILFLTGCGGKDMENYQQISQEQAKEMMDAGSVVILVVRDQYEYDAGHIPGAVLLPLGAIDEESAAGVIPDQDADVLVYCRSGSRSKKAAAALAGLGYTAIYEFGGITTWPYEITE